MNATKLQAKLYGGYAKAAQRLGLPCSLYRPTSCASVAIALGNYQRTLAASFNAEDMGYSKPNKYGKATWYCLADGTLMQPGDYLVQPDGSTFFIAGMQPLLPILVVGCNRVVNILRPGHIDSVGGLPYEGETAINPTALVIGWPASVLQGSKGEKSLVNLPGDVRIPWWVVLLPRLPGITLRNDDIMTDDLGRRYKISSAEQTDLGWRMAAIEAET